MTRLLREHIADLCRLSVVGKVANPGQAACILSVATSVRLMSEPLKMMLKAEFSEVRSRLLCL